MRAYVEMGTCMARRIDSDDLRSSRPEKKQVPGVMTTSRRPDPREETAIEANHDCSWPRWHTILSLSSYAGRVRRTFDRPEGSQGVAATAANGL